MTAKGTNLTEVRSNGLQESLPSNNEQFQQLGSQLSITGKKVTCLEVLASDYRRSVFSKEALLNPETRKSWQEKGEVGNKTEKSLRGKFLGT